MPRAKSEATLTPNKTKMIHILSNKPTKEQIRDITQMYQGYAKVVVDIENNILAAGGEYHIDCEQVLINSGSNRDNLWGGGYRFENKEVDFMGMTNYKPHLNHFSYEISIPEKREELEKIIRGIFEWIEIN